MLTAEREVGTSAVGLGRRLDLGLAVSRPTWTGSLPLELAIMLHRTNVYFHRNHEAGFV